MIAAKGDPIWERLGTDFPDSLGNPFPPFAAESHYCWRPVRRAECVALGVPLPEVPPDPKADMIVRKLGKGFLEEIRNRLDAEIAELQRRIDRQ